MSEGKVQQSSWAEIELGGLGGSEAVGGGRFAIAVGEEQFR